MNTPDPDSPIATLPSRSNMAWLLLGVWALLVAASLGLSIERIQQHAHALLKEGARNVFNTITAARGWNAKSGGLYVAISQKNQPNPHLETKRRELHPVEGGELTQINPAYMTRLIADELAPSGKLSLHMTSLNVIRPENAPDAWERRALEGFEKDHSEVAEIVERANAPPQFRYMAPLLVEQSCLNCHTRQTYKVGDVRGGISVSQPYDRAALRTQILHTSALHLLVFLLVSGGGVLALRAQRKHQAQADKSMASLLQAEKMASMGRLVAGFAHELNTPLGVAIGAISHAEQCIKDFQSMLQRDEVSEEEVSALLADMQDSNTLSLSNLRRAAGLVSGFKRSSSDIEREDIRRVKLIELIEDVLQTLRNVYKKSARIELDCPDDLYLTSVPGLLDQIFTNLIINSVTHAFEPGRHDGNIRISVVSSGTEYVLISFADDGIGMERDVLNRIFEPFFTTRQNQGGSGLGLYICYSLITERLGGSIRCDSLPGGGTHFLISLPLNAPFTTKSDTP